MNKLFAIFLFMLMPSYLCAKETIVLYDKINIPSWSGGRQISKSYYFKESVRIVDIKKPSIRQVKTYRKVTDESGSTEYKCTYLINCATKKYTCLKYWSTGFGEDNGLFVDGKWYSVSEYIDMKELAKQVCAMNLK